MNIERIKALREANRVEMEKENAQKAQAAIERAAEEERQAKRREAAAADYPAQMAMLAQLVLDCPGRGLSRRHVAKLVEIRDRNARNAK